MPKSARVITVQAARQDRRVAFVEEHPDHPNEGQAWVVGDGRTVAVAVTAGVQAALGRGDIVEVQEAPHAGLPPEQLAESVAPSEQPPPAEEPVPAEEPARRGRPSSRG